MNDYLYDNRRSGKKGFIAFGILVAILLVVYIGGGIYFKKHLIPGTYINGVDCGAMTIEDAKKAIKDEADNYKLTLIERENNEESFTGKDVGISVDFDKEMDSLYDMQNSFTWPVGMFNDVNKSVGVNISVDDKLLSDTLDNLACYGEDRYREPADAKIEVSSDATFSIIPEDVGTKLDKDKVYDIVKGAVTGLVDKVDFEKEECYINPKHYATDADISAACDKANKYASTEINYEFGDEIFPLDSNTIAGFIDINPDTFEIKLKRKPMLAYVSEMSEKYSTIYKTRTFRTSYDYDVTISRGDYGWWINEGETIKQFSKAILEGKSANMEPVYYQRATAFGENDIGDSYVEVNLSMQHVLLYNKGKLVAESDCVTGRNNAYTPPGIYSITFKDHTFDDHQVALVGENYSSEVSYFIPFFGNIGLHDAPWRSQFGGSIYKKSGSHGCVNLPLSMAESIYEYVEKGMAVIVYQDPNNPAYDSDAKMSEIYEGGNEE